MINKEALARISINKLLEDAGWRFFPNEKGIANIQLEPNVKITQLDLDGIELKKKKNGFMKKDCEHMIKMSLSFIGHRQKGKLKRKRKK